MHRPSGAHRSRLNPGALLRSQRSAEGVRHARREPDCEGGHAGEDVRAAKHKRAAGPQAYDSGLGRTRPRVDAGAADGCEQLREGEPAAARGRERCGVSGGGRDGATVRVAGEYQGCEGGVEGGWTAQAVSVSCRGLWSMFSVFFSFFLFFLPRG